VSLLEVLHVAMPTVATADMRRALLVGAQKFADGAHVEQKIVP
jgi:hypothetical protein